MWNAQLSHDNRCKQDYQQDHKEYQRWVSNRKVLCHIKHIVGKVT